MKKIKIFISHINEESEIARAVHDILNERFLGIIDFFLSTHKESIKVGDNWFDTIKSSMDSADLLILLCSPISITRPWINFEAGAGWNKNIPVIPLCHSGLSPANLSAPLSFYQGSELNSNDGFERLFIRVADMCNTNVPPLQADEFFNLIKSFEGQVINSLLFSDTNFINNLLDEKVKLLKYNIIASTIPQEKLNYNSLFELLKIDPNFNFNSIVNLFNDNHYGILNRKKVYVAYYETIMTLKENIKFLLMYNNLTIAPFIRELFNTMVFAQDIFDWYNEICKAEEYPVMKKQAIEMIAEQINIPQLRNNANIINVYIIYFKSLEFNWQWIQGYEMNVKSILNEPSL